MKQISIEIYLLRLLTILMLAGGLGTLVSGFYFGHGNTAFGITLVVSAAISMLAAYLPDEQVEPRLSSLPLRPHHSDAASNHGHQQVA